MKKQSNLQKLLECVGKYKFLVYKTVLVIANRMRTVSGSDKIIVLKDDGVLIAPTFTYAGNEFLGNVKAFFMKLVGFRQYSKWSSESYLDFLREQGWIIRKIEVLKASFPLTYAECIKS